MDVLHSRYKGGIHPRQATAGPAHICSSFQSTDLWTAPVAEAGFRQEAKFFRAGKYFSRHPAENDKLQPEITAEF
ncbi:hypothetical protein LSTR_LSTR015736 [Laodelphax striatellus]|uniref:Uncharacterized protein n=1 Tax=Laodelphax striatellus TaxID=195883 RepID=A0A482WFZ0_LAOST|nr:hypothetical protein LSTR_LSTR015736 [Laodelphax striatellus]